MILQNKRPRAPAAFLPLEIHMENIKYTVGEDGLSAGEFIDFAGKVWPGNYDEKKLRLP